MHRHLQVSSHPACSLSNRSWQPPKGLSLRAAHRRRNVASTGAAHRGSRSQLSPGASPQTSLVGEHALEHPLAGGLQHGTPQLRIDVHGPPFLRDQLQGQMHVPFLQLADDDVRAAGHGGVDGVLPEESAVDLVVGVGRDGPDDVAGVDVLEGIGNPLGTQMGIDRAPQQGRDVPELLVAGGVAGGGLAQKVLARPLGGHDDGVLAVDEALLQRLEQSPLPFEFEGGLGDQHEVHVLHGQGGPCGDEPRLPPHELHEADAVGRAAGLGVGALDGLRGLEHRGLEAEGLGDEVDVVVDGLRDADDRHLQPPLADLLADAQRGLHGAVAADDEQGADVAPLQEVHDFLGGLRPPGGPEDGAPEPVDVGHGGGGELKELVLVLGDEPFQAVGDAKDGRHVVGVVALEDDGPYDVVDPGAQAAAGHDGALGPRRVEVEAAAGAGGLEADACRLDAQVGEFLVQIDVDAIIVGPRPVWEARFQLAGAEDAHSRVQAVGLGLFRHDVVASDPRCVEGRNCAPLCLV